MISKSRDYLNRQKTRNVKNTCPSDYNCGGYALRTFSWYLPYDDISHSDLAEEMYQNGMSKEEIELEILQHDLEVMKEDFPDKLIYIKSLDEAAPEDTVIAYRLYIKIYDDKDEMCENVDTDFHFRVRSNNIWTEKCGSDPILPCTFSEEPWDNGGDCIYDSPILYFVLKDN